MKKLIVSSRFFVTRTDKDGEIYAEVGDSITIKERGYEHYTILKLNDKLIFSIWLRKNWIESHCLKITEKV